MRRDKWKRKGCFLLANNVFFPAHKQMKDCSKILSDLDSRFYKKADAFFASEAQYALTYDDVSLATEYSDILPKEAHLETHLSERLVLPVPIVSSDMDTVTESSMAIAMALSGGMGLIHYNMSPAQQVRELARVKHFVHGLIQDPISVSPEAKIAEVLLKIEQKRYGFDTFPVVDAHNHLLGLLPGYALRARQATKSAHEVMIPRSAVKTILAKDLGKDPIYAADQFFQTHWDADKLLVVDDQDCLRGLFTRSDIERILEEAQSHVRPCRGHDFRLACGAAVAIPRTLEGAIDTELFLQHVGALAEAGLDAIAVSSAHAHTKNVGEAVRFLRQHFPTLTLIAGNVTSAEGVGFLAEAGADVIKVGQGPGSICTTRVVAGVGIPQLSALYLASRAAQKFGVKILADGGITKSGDIVKALTLADAVVCGSLLAGCPEAPGDIIDIEGKRYKQYRGMGSLSAMQAGSAARYGHSQGDKFKKAASEGIEALKELSEPVHIVLARLIGGLQAGMGYLGAKDLAQLQDRARFVRVSAAGLRESNPHDVVEVKMAPKL